MTSLKTPFPNTVTFGSTRVRISTYKFERTQFSPNQRARDIFILIFIKYLRNAKAIGALAGCKSQSVRLFYSIYCIIYRIYIYYINALWANTQFQNEKLNFMSRLGIYLSRWILCMFRKPLIKCQYLGSHICVDAFCTLGKRIWRQSSLILTLASQEQNSS